MTGPLSVGRHVQHMVDTLADQLGRSVVIDDPAVRMIYTSRHFGDEDPVRIRAILQHDAGPEVGRFILAQGAARWHGPHVVRASAELGLHSRLCVPLYGPGWLLGFLMVMDADGSLTPAEIEHIDKTSRDIAAQLYADSLAADPRRLERRAALRDLLGEDGAARRAALATLQVEHDARRTGTAAVTTVHIGTPAAADTPIDIALPTALDGPARARAVLSDFVIDGTRATLLQFRDRPPSDLRVQAEHIRAELHRLLGPDSNPAIGLGTVEGHLDQAWQARRRADIAVRAALRGLGSPDGIAHWDDLGAHAVLLEIPDRALTWSTIPAPVRELLARDGSGKLLDTLRSFLDHGGSIARTATALHMHRTSLYYRLDRIRSITGLDLDDGRDRLLLHLGVRLLDLVDRPAD
ncbi:PucR family transcriptional regulator [Nocardia blacklockiae]|uniref:PucR family transcriptional regulator n=1 Tax=Nocardia blacklockiae TaxID=480036 RepID=UPI001895CFB5|nr:helix-turn-helix domain-containing protein [Nocardia blacklockiae]MBF6174076.1 helix-turn-helix domain-containing protein [Nocardia blacklockiae]